MTNCRARFAPEHRLKREYTHAPLHSVCGMAVLQLVWANAKSVGSEGFPEDHLERKKGDQYRDTIFQEQFLYEADLKEPLPELTNIALAQQPHLPDFNRESTSVAQCWNDFFQLPETFNNLRRRPDPKL